MAMIGFRTIAIVYTKTLVKNNASHLPETGKQRTEYGDVFVAAKNNEQ
jgi:hypothetical protein